MLRHQPGSIGLVLDEQVWADLDELIAKANASGRRCARAELLEVVGSNDKQRFTLSEDGRRIRGRCRPHARRPTSPTTASG